MKPTTRRTLVAAAVVVALGAAGAEARDLHTVDAGGGLYVQQVFGRALIREVTGVRELALPAGGLVRRLERTDAGWIVAGEIDAPGTRDLFLLAGGGEDREIPVPPNPGGHPLRINPVPLVQDGQLVAIAWIAGEGLRQSAVFASLWSGSDWSPAERVSPVGPGTQIGLAGAVLHDGSWLLAWSAYDGNDDEIVWSRRDKSGWSAPAALHAENDRPDIVPTLIATGRGALAGWSSSNGQTYRVRLAAFEGGAWRELDWSGPEGSVRPALTREGERLQLMYRTAVPASWTLLELDARGNPLRKVVLDHESTFRPGLLPRGELAPTFEWPGVDTAIPHALRREWQELP